MTKARPGRTTPTSPFARVPAAAARGGRDEPAAPALSAIPPAGELPQREEARRDRRGQQGVDQVLTREQERKDRREKINAARAPPAGIAGRRPVDRSAKRSMTATASVERREVSRAA